MQECTDYLTTLNTESPLLTGLKTNACLRICWLNPAIRHGRTVRTGNELRELEYYDDFGNLDRSKMDSGGPTLKTGFTYDILGDMTSSTPPGGSSYKTSYAYNSLGELTSKTTPDAGTTQYLYDLDGNLRLIKDANHSGSANPGTFVNQTVNTNASGSFTLTMPGEVNLSSIRDMDFTGGATGTLAIQKNGVTLISTTGGSSPGNASLYLPKGTYNYNFTISGGGEFGYEVTLGASDEFLYHKYDGLNRLIEAGEYRANATTDFTQLNANTVSFPSSNSFILRQYVYDTPSGQQDASGQTNILGRLSYTTVNGVEGNQERVTSYSYDNRGRTAWKVIWGSALYYPKKTTYTYNLQGNLTQRGFIDQDSRSNPFYWNYSYDVAGRLDNVQTDGNGTLTQDATQQYFASGKSSQLTLGPSPLATVNYHYNQRDWVTNINSSDYWEQIGYNSPQLGATPQYNGNISSVTYSISGDSFTPSSQDMGGFPPSVQPAPTTTLGYSFAYDGANRLLNGNFAFELSNSWSAADISYKTSYAYNADGDPSSLVRYRDNATESDNLGYNYQSGTHRLSSISNSAGTGSSYTYDYDGNVASDSKANVAFTIYDPFNEAVEVWLTSGTEYKYGYDVNGTRILKNWGGSNWNFYMNDPDGKTFAINLEPYSQDQVYNVWAGNSNIGQVRYGESSGYSYYYYIKDHLGDIRMVLNSSGVVDSYNDYYPFGEQMPGRNLSGSADGRYKYISVEQDPETSLYATGPRLYDPWSGMFLGVDPMASDSTLAPWSPYQYSFDNPVRFKDPTGKWPDWATLGIEVGSWIQNEFSGAESATMARMNYTGGSAPSSQMQIDGPGPIAAATTQSSMSKLAFHALSNFAYAEGAGSFAALGAEATAMTIGLSPEISLASTVITTTLTFRRDYGSGSNYWNLIAPVSFGFGGYAAGVPSGALYGGAGFGSALYFKIIPPPPSMNLGR